MCSDILLWETLIDKTGSYSGFSVTGFKVQGGVGLYCASFFG